MLHALFLNEGETEIDKLNNQLGLINPRIALGVKKTQVRVSKNMKWVRNATTRSSIGAPEVICHDVKHVKFMVILTNMTKQIQNKYCCNSSDKG